VAKFLAPFGGLGGGPLILFGTTPGPYHILSPPGHGLDEFLAGLGCDGLPGVLTIQEHL